MGAVTESVQALSPTALDDRPSLLERGRWTGVDEWKTRAVGDRVVLPAFESAESVPEAHASLESGQGIRGLLAVGPVEQQLMASMAEVDSVAEALDVFIRSGQGAVVRGTGERIDPDGVFRLGQAEDAGVLAMRLADELTAPGLGMQRWPVISRRTQRVWRPVSMRPNVCSRP